MNKNLVKVTDCTGLGIVALCDDHSVLAFIARLNGRDNYKYNLYVAKDNLYFHEENRDAISLNTRERFRCNINLEKYVKICGDYDADEAIDLMKRMFPVDRGSLFRNYEGSLGSFTGSLSIDSFTVYGDFWKVI